MESGLRDKVVIVTGASGGIGQEVTRLFAEEGAKVVIHYFRGKERAQKLAEELSGEYEVVGADLRVESDVQRMFEAVESKLGPVDVLVANAGVWPPADTPISEMSIEQWNETLSIDMTSVFLCVREYLKRAKANSHDAPAIVMIGSTAGHFGEAGHADYAASKSGLMNGLMASLKNEIPKFARLGRINTVCPGWTLTPLAEKFADSSDSMVRALQTIPLRKFACPRDIANSVVFLSSNVLAGHITGQSLFVSGGMEGRVLFRAEEIDLLARAKGEC